MRVLLATYAERSHFRAMVPLGQALVAAGHEVRVASQPALAGAITGTGLTAVTVGRDHDAARILRARPELAVLAGAANLPPFDLVDRPLEEVTWEAVSSGYAKVVPWWFRVASESMIDELVEFCRAWRPDLVLWEPTTFAAPLAATVVGAAHARLPWSMDLFGAMREHFVRLRDERAEGKRRDLLAEWLGRWAGRYGVAFDEVMTCGHVTIDQLPAEVRLPTELRCLPMRYVPYNGAAVVPRWLREPPGRPRVCLTLGTSATQVFGGYRLDIEELVTALSGLDVEVVAAVPGAGSGGWRVPGNVRVVDFVPLHVLAGTCAVVVHHGGWGSACTSGVNGVPQLVLAEQFDGPPLARRLVAQGGALALEEGRVSGVGVAEGVVRLLEDPGFGRGAARLRERMLAMPAPAEVVPALEQLAAEHRS
ncbi:activator-dependent family glycosyltransferase [Sphaerisporangium dianthi]|uniref:Activator-dependent family glycosyltransferase n=1 Tax=Sphaerisporangium dianthi TaxID=1436120 RepID=A0ABV9CT08_9ACTN